MGRWTRLDISSNRRNALLVALVMMVLVSVIHQIAVSASDVERMRELSELTGVDIRNIPPWFASGAGENAEVFAVMAADPLGVELAWILSGLLVIIMSTVVFDTPYNAVRAAGMLPVLWAFGDSRSAEHVESESPLLDVT